MVATADVIIHYVYSILTIWKKKHSRNYLKIEEHEIDRLWRSKWHALWNEKTTTFEMRFILHFSYCCIRPFAEFKYHMYKYIDMQLQSGTAAAFCVLLSNRLLIWPARRNAFKTELQKPIHASTELITISAANSNRAKVPLQPKITTKHIMPCNALHWMIYFISNVHYIIVLFCV